MKKKQLIFLFLALIFIILIALYFGVFKNEKATIYVATDTHYLSPRINDKSEAFENMLATSDGKLVQCCDEIMDSFCDKVIEQKPDVVILSGDLTFKGEKASHEDLVKKLNKIQDNGIQVLTIAGNHDINSNNSAQYINNEAIATDNISAEEFKDMYYNFGMAQAESVDKYSLSYTYKVNKDLYILMIDTNAYGQNFVQDPSYEWIESQLKQIKKKHAKVITVSHQNLFAHNEQLSFGYQLYDANELLELYKEYDVKLNLSGHIHMQHIKTDQVTEIATSSLLVSPVQYGILDVKNNIKYHTEKLDVKSIDNFSDYAEKCFKESGTYKSLQQLASSDLSSEEKELIANTFAALNTSYFAGTKIDITPYEEGIKLINQQDGFLKNYINTMAEEAENDYTTITIK